MSNSISEIFVTLKDNLAKYIESTYHISNKKLIKQLRLNEHPKWDSLAHSKLLSIIEKNFKSIFR